MNYTYIVECADGSLYCGWTNDLEKRIADHNDGKGGKYTRSRLPVKLVYFEEFETKEEAMSKVDADMMYISSLSLSQTFSGTGTERRAILLCASQKH